MSRSKSRRKSQGEEVPAPPLWVCKRCGHKWYSRKPGIPLICPRCNSPYWNREYQVAPEKRGGRKKTKTQGVQEGG